MAIWISDYSEFVFFVSPITCRSSKVIGILLVFRNCRNADLLLCLWTKRRWAIRFRRFYQRLGDLYWLYDATRCYDSIYEEIVTSLDGSGESSMYKKIVEICTSSLKQSTHMSNANFPSTVGSTIFSLLSAYAGVGFSFSENVAIFNWSDLHIYGFALLKTKKYDRTDCLRAWIIKKWKCCNMKCDSPPFTKTQSVFLAAD